MASTTRKAVCIIQARLGSTRLPGKVLKEICGKPLIAHVVERAQHLQVDQVVVTVPEHEVSEFMFLSGQYGITIFGGSEHDVLDRYYQAAAICHPDVIVRVTGDCPLYDPTIGNTVIQAWCQNQWKFCTNDTSISGYPDGTDTEVFRYLFLANAARKATTQYDREHVTPWIRCNTNVCFVKSHIGYPSLKLSVDTEHDFALVQSIYNVVDAVAIELGTPRYSLATTLEAARIIGSLRC